MQSLGTEPLIRSSHVRETHNQDGAVLLDPLRGQCYPLNPVAALIWKQLGEGCTPLQIAQKVASTCNTPFDVASADVLEFVQSLLDAELVSPQNAVDPKRSRCPWLKGLLGRFCPSAEGAVRDH